MAKAVQLFDLFGDFRMGWPSTALRDHVGEDIGAPPSQVQWLDALNDSFTVTDIRTGATADGVGVEAQLHTTGFAQYPDGWPLNFASMPYVLFKVLAFEDVTDGIRLFASVSDGGVEVLLEGVPVEITLPTGLVTPPVTLSQDSPSRPPAHKEVGTFEPGSLDSLKIVYDEVGPTSIFVHVRVRATAGGEYAIETAVPVSFEACNLSGLPGDRGPRLPPDPVARDRARQDGMAAPSPDAVVAGGHRPVRRPVRVPLAGAGHERPGDPQHADATEGDEHRRAVHRQQRAGREDAEEDPGDRARAGRHRAAVVLAMAHTGAAARDGRPAPAPGRAVGPAHRLRLREGAGQPPDRALRGSASSSTRSSIARSRSTGPRRTSVDVLRRRSSSTRT